MINISVLHVIRQVADLDTAADKLHRYVIEHLVNGNCRIILHTAADAVHEAFIKPLAAPRYFYDVQVPAVTLCRCLARCGMHGRVMLPDIVKKFLVEQFN